MTRFRAPWMCLRALLSRRTKAAVADETGGIGLLGLGLSVCVCMLLVGGVSVASAQMARLDVLDAADHASAAAADRISLAGAYTEGVDNATLDADAASAEAARIVASTPLPKHVTSWRVRGVEVVGEQVTVRVRAVVRPPVVGSAMAALGEPMTVDVVSRADAHLER